MKHEFFGKLVWNGIQWEQGIAIPYFRGWGKAIYDRRREKILSPPTKPRPRLRPLTDCRLDREFELSEWGDKHFSGVQREQESGPFDADRLFKQGKFKLAIRVSGPANMARPPSRAQAEAWRKLLERGDALWDELVKKILADYQVQHPLRVRWWKATFGDLPYRYELPKVKTRNELKDVLRLLRFRILPVSKGTPVADISMHFACPWIVDGFSAYIRDGKLIGLGESWMLSGDARPSQTIKHRALGLLEEHGDGRWRGTLRYGPFRDFSSLAEDRAKFLHDRLRCDRPQSLMHWDFAHGQFPMVVHASTGEPPREAQVRAVQAFVKGQRKYWAGIADMIFKRYRQDFEANAAEARREYPEEYIEEICPDAGSVGDLSRCVELREVHVHPPGPTGVVTIGLEFICSWGDRGFSVLWRNGKVLRIGESHEARPPR